MPSNFLLATARIALRSWLNKSPRDRAADARALSQELIANGVRDDLASVAPSDVVDTFDRFLRALGEWQGA